MNGNYETTSIFEASFLRAKHHDLLRMESTGESLGEHSKVQFVFEKTKQLDSDVGEFWNNKGFVPAKVLFDNFRGLKDLMFSRSSI